MSETPASTSSDDPEHKRLASESPGPESVGRESATGDDCGGDIPEFQGEVSDEQMAKIAKAIADPQRFAILCSISAQEEVPCKTLVADFPITQATISHHLKELVAAGLIRSRRQGQMAILSCRRDVCGAYTDMLTQRLTK